MLSVGSITARAPDGRPLRMVGTQAFAELRRLRPALRVVVMSGFHDQEVLERFPAGSLAGFLQKPLSLDVLRATMREVLDPSRPAPPR